MFANQKNESMEPSFRRIKDEDFTIALFVL